jgi:hypothetical protein
MLQPHDVGDARGERPRIGRVGSDAALLVRRGQGRERSVIAGRLGHVHRQEQDVVGLLQL